MPPAEHDQRVHGTAVAAGDLAALIRGPSGSGKSDLALRFLQLRMRRPEDTPLEPEFLEPSLVADDQVILKRDGHDVWAAPPDVLAGLLEVRGLGILKFPHRAPARLTLIVDLCSSSEVDRLPDPWPHDPLLGVALPVLRLVPFEPSAALKLALALTRMPWRSEDPRIEQD